ncbi:hypothetical protein D9V41_10900 [Aeromicrobium phragmitis]|uniref:LPXTG cell wall anchor domain-containing protein n=1 Tax=Aeromicrobium phragmitis TaxID=2478914 RepID=A0A3L8PK69_9ACTN|nr:hypothetical protein [Aeromicrobium phragmitis]RLV55584.1 hypothetical protein D9V41_10900 [Aeromicrobium phragmitis]
MRTLAVVAALALIAHPTVGVAAPEIRVVPGERYVAEVPANAVFDAKRRWVPGEERSVEFTVRNDGEENATSVWVALEGGNDPDALLADEHVRLDVRVDDGAWQPLQPDGTPAVVRDTVVTPGTTTAVTLRATFDAAAGNVTQRSSLDLPLVVGMSGDQDGPVPAPGQLPATGSVLGPVVVVGGLLLLLIGHAVRPRKERRPR